jgi:hypothetical protein
MAARPRSYPHRPRVLDTVLHDPHRAQRLLRALARNVAMDHAIARITAEADGDETPLSRTRAGGRPTRFSGLWCVGSDSAALVQRIRDRKKANPRLT